MQLQSLMQTVALCVNATPARISRETNLCCPCVLRSHVAVRHSVEKDRSAVAEDTGAAR